MASDFQSSFIPKGPAAEAVFKKKKVGLLGTLAVFLLILTVVIYVGLFVYKNIVKNEIKNIQTELAATEENIDKEAINEMSRFSKKLDMVETIVFKHQVVSNFLDSLASSTVSSIQFTSFNYDSLKEGKITVKLQGKASNYASIALQEDVFSQNKYFNTVSFSNLDLTDKGKVSFDLAISVDSKISVYSP